LKDSNQADVLVSDIQDSNGKTLLHECTMADSFMCLKALIRLVKVQLETQQQIAEWINRKDNGDGFTALHFASFKGKPDACELLID